MVSSTPAQLSRATKYIANGNADFTILSDNQPDDGPAKYIVSVPFAIGRLHGRTAFGRQLLAELNQTPDVEVSEDANSPYVLILHIEPGRAGSPPEGGFHYSSHGLHADICASIQAVITRNRTPLKQFAEWFRRLI